MAVSEGRLSHYLIKKTCCRGLRFLVGAPGCIHPRHRDISAEWNGLNSVLGVPFSSGEQRRTKADHELGDVHAKLFGGVIMPPLVKSNRDQKAQSNNNHAQNEEQYGIHAHTLLEPTDERA